ncbi:MAG: HYR domain-containing protein, partial [Saprospiraceae bacterium]
SGLLAGNYTATVSDGNGCTKTTTATISLTDNQPPVLNLKNATVMLGANSLATVTPQMFDNGSVDLACSIASWTVSPTTFDCSKVGNNAVIITATDTNGNTSSGTAMVTVQDNIVPVMTCPVNTTVGFCHPVVQYAVPQVTDNCPFSLENLALTQGLSSGSIFPVGTTQQQYKYVDASGNQAVCTFTVTVAPALQATVTTVPSGCSGGCSGSASLQVSGGTFSTAWSNGQTSPQITDLCPGAYSVTVQDSYGCSQTRNFDVTGGDTEVPVLLVHNATISLDADGVIMLDAGIFDAGSSDNCGIAAWMFEPAILDCSSIGTHPVHITIKDANGNAADQVVSVTVLDPIVPVLHCPDNLQQSFCHSLTSYAQPTVLDNCPVNPGALQLISGLPSGSIFPVNVATTQTFKYTDAAGNTAQCSFQVTVAPVPDVQIAGTPVSCAGACDGQVNLNVSGGIGTQNYVWSNGQTTATINGLCPGAYIVTLTDGQGCLTIRTTNVGQPATLNITVNSMQSPSGSGNNGNIQVTINGGTAPYSYLWQRNGGFFSNLEDLSNLNDGQYFLQVTDAHGCSVVSATLTLGSVATAEPDWAQGLRLSPNPARDQVTLLWDKPQGAVFEITVCDLAGRIVRRCETETSAVASTLDVSDLPAGLWLVRLLSTNGSTVVRRLVIEK